MTARDEAHRELPPTVRGLPFDRFYELNNERLHRSLSVTLGDATLAADSLAEAMTRAFDRWAKICEYDNPSGWVYRVALNHSHKRWRSRSREQLSADPGLYAVPRFDESLVHLADVLAGLPINQRAVVVLRYIDRLSTRETAEVLGIAEGTVQSRLSRARTELQRQLRAPERPRVRLSS